jgi:hypothetical protein
MLNVDITNATKGDKMAGYPFNVIVSNSNAQKKIDPVETLTFQTGPDGTFSGEIDVQEKTSLTVEVNYRGINYRSQTVEVKKSEENLSLPVPVYDISDRKENIAITERIVTLIPKNERVMQVYDHLKIENRGKTSYVGKFNDELDLTQVLNIPMPAGYVLTNIQGIPYNMTYSRSNALITREEIKPGQHVVTLNYHVISDTGFFDFSLYTQKDAPETSSLSLYFPEEESWKIKLSGLTPAGEQVMGNRTYSIWKGASSDVLRKGASSDVLRIKAYGPTYVQTTLLWTISIFMLFGVTVTVLSFCREPVRLWYMKREKKRLDSLLSAVKDETGESGTDEFYSPFLPIISGRLKELKQRLES